MPFYLPSPSRKAILNYEEKALLLSSYLLFLVLNRYPCGGFMVKSMVLRLLAIGLAILIGSPQYSPTTARSEAITRISSPAGPIPLQQLPSLGPKCRPAGCRMPRNPFANPNIT